MPLEIGCRDEAEVSFARQEASQSSDGVFHAALLPGTMGITEEGWEFQCLVEPVMVGELVSIVEADGFAHRLWKLAESMSDGSSGEGSFSIARAVNDVKAGLSFVENQQSLATSGKQHEVGFPMTRRPPTFDLSRSFSDRAPLFDEAGAAASASPSYFLVTRQQAIPVILLGRSMIDEAID